MKEWIQLDPPMKWDEFYAQPFAQVGVQIKVSPHKVFSDATEQTYLIGDMALSNSDGGGCCSESVLKDYGPNGERIIAYRDLCSEFCRT